MLETRKDSSFDRVFPFIGVFMDRRTGEEEDSSMARVHAAN